MRSSRSAFVLTFALAGSACAGTSGYVTDGVGGGQFLVPSSTDTGTYTFFIEGRPHVVWYEIRQVLRHMRIGVDREGEDAESARLVTRRFSVNPDDVHCGARPSGEQPLARAADGVLRADLTEAGSGRTQVTFRLDARSSSIEPDRSGVRTVCVSRGLLERRIVESTQRRMP